MSGRLVSIVFHSDLAPALKPIAAALASFADDDGRRIRPSVARVAWMVGRSERTVQTALTKLRAGGILTVVFQATQHRATEYQLHADKLPARPGWAPARGEIAAAPLAPPVDPPGVQSDASRGEASCTRSVSTDPSVQRSLPDLGTQQQAAPATIAARLPFPDEEPGTAALPIVRATSTVPVAAAASPPRPRAPLQQGFGPLPLQSLAMRLPGLSNQLPASRAEYERVLAAVAARGEAIEAARRRHKQAAIAERRRRYGGRW